MNKEASNKFFCFRSKKQFFYYLIIAVIIGIIASGGGCLVFDCKSKVYSLFIKDFDQCANAGFPVISADPPRCLIGENNVFIRDPKHIRVFEPKPNDYVSSPMTIKGEARALNNQVGFELKTDNGEILKKGIIPANSNEHGRWGDYETEINFQTKAESGILEVFDITPEDQRINVLKVPVVFKEEMEEEAKKDSSDSQGEENQILNPLEKAKQEELPPKAQLEVPFTSQAPYQNWDPPYDEACEEASIIMVHYYLQAKNLNTETANNQIILLTEWQKNHGYEVDVDLGELDKITRAYYEEDYQPYIYENDKVTIENIKALINAGYPVIVPAAGQDLENPNFRGAGPPYHMLVITGYDESHFITNDPGTRNGEDFVYTYKNLFNSIHDWTGNKDNIREGEKAIMVMEE